MSQAEMSSSSPGDPWAWWRAQMPICAKWAYLDHAAVGPLARPTADAIRSFATEAETEGDTVWPQWAQNFESLRRSFADLLGADSDEIALVPNTSTGINLVAEGFPWQPGDNVVVPEGEFPSNLFPWQNQQMRGVEVRVVPRRGNAVLADDLLERVDDSTKLIALSWIGYASGYRADIEEIVDRAHRHGALVFLDAIQGLGIFDLNVRETPVDFLAADGHKWLLGPEGLGVAYIRRKHLDLLRCGNVGWNSVRNCFNYSNPKLELRQSAARFEPGSPNMVGAAGLCASLQMFQSVRKTHGVHAIGDRVVALVEELQEQLSAIGIQTLLPPAKARSGIVTFEVPGTEPTSVRRIAMDHGCVVSCRGGGIRASLHAYNDGTDIERLVAAVADCLSHSSRVSHT